MVWKIRPPADGRAVDGRTSEKQFTGADAAGDIVSLRDVIESNKSTLSERPLPNALANCLSCSKYYASTAALHSGSSKQTQF